MKTSSKIAIASGSVFASIAALLIRGHAFAAYSIGDKVCHTAGCADGDPTGAVAGIVETITNAIIGIVGVLAVLMIVWGGIQMMTSSGDPGKVKKGKDTVIWGLIGMVIAIFAYTIRDMVYNAVTGNAGGIDGTLAWIGTEVGQVVTLIFGIIGIIAVGVTIWGGIQMMISTGDPGKIKKGKDTLIWGIVGLLIALFSYTIVGFVLNSI